MGTGTDNFSAAVVGAGAIGSWIADALDRAGSSVSVLARGATLSALRSQGLRVERDGVSRVSRPRAGSAQELGVHDVVFLAVKAQMLPTLAPSLRPLLGPHTRLVSATNGIPWWFFQGFDGPLLDETLESVDPGAAQRDAFARQIIIGSVIHATVHSLAPAQARVVAADRLLLGAPDGAATEELQALISALRRGGIKAEASAHIRSDVWAKLWGNMNMNPVSALTRSGTAGILADPDVRQLCLRMMEEMQQCAEQLGLAVGMSASDRIAVTQRLGDFKTSMLADVEADRALEIAPQLGAVVEIADRLRIAAPFSHAVLGLARLLSK